MKFLRKLPFIFRAEGKSLPDEKFQDEISSLDINRVSLNYQDSLLKFIQKVINESQQKSISHSRHLSTLKSEKTELEKYCALKDDELNSQKVIIFNLENALLRNEDKIKEADKIIGALKHERNKLLEQNSELKNVVDFNREKNAKLELIEFDNEKLRSNIERLSIESKYAAILLKHSSDLMDMMEEYKLSLSHADILKRDSDNRWRRLKNIYPEHINYECLELLDADGVHSPPFLIFKLDGLNYKGVESFIEFKIEIDNGYKIVFSAPEFCEAFSMDISLKKSGVVTSKNYPCLSPIQWELWKSVIYSIEVSSNSNWDKLVIKKNFEMKFWGGFIRDFLSTAKKLPATLRLDGVKLVRFTRHEDYSHLWLRFASLSYGSFLREDFEFRFSAANLEKDGTSQFPKIEFPLIKGVHKPFDSWYHESSDEYGQKFELRFSLKSLTFDVRALNRLSYIDKNIVMQIVLNLPRIMSDLEVNEFKLPQEFSWWKSFATSTANLLIILLERAEVSRKSKTYAPKEQVESGNDKIVKKIYVKSQG